MLSYVGLKAFVSKLVSQSVKNSVKYFFLNFHIILVEEFMVDLKTFLCLSMSNQYCLDYTGFGVIFRDKKSLTSMIPMYSTTILYDSHSTCNDDKDLEKFQFSMLATKLQIQYTQVHV